MGTTMGTSDSRSASPNWRQVGRASLGQPSRCASIKITANRQRAVTAAGVMRARKVTRTEAARVCPSSMMTLAGGPRIPIAVAEAMGLLVPPAIFMIVLGQITDTSVVGIFLAGFIPAADTALCLFAVILIE